MKDTKAIRPGSFNFQDYIKEDREQPLKPNEEEQILSQGKQGAFWKTLRKYFDNELTQLDLIQDNAIARGATRDQIGENAVVISLTKGVLKRIIHRVEDKT